MTVEDKSRPPIREYLVLPIAVGAALLYGLALKLLLTEQFFPNGTLSLSFFFLAPPALGAITVALASDRRLHSWPFTIFAPWIPTCLALIIAGLFTWEFWFCVFLASPLFLGLASLGGILARIIRLRAHGPKRASLLLLIALPLLASPIERLFPPTTSIRQVHSQVLVNAPPEVVWANITNLDPISQDEAGLALFRVVGLPRPLEAHMACGHVGCVRRGSWEHGLAFDGTISLIEPPTRYWVQLEADVRAIEPSLAPLAGIGGPTFAMIDDGYSIEVADNEHVILHLYSSYRITSGINSYATLWLDALLQDIQRHILGIEKARSEAQAG